MEMHVLYIGNMSRVMEIILKSSRDSGVGWGNNRGAAEECTDIYKVERRAATDVRQLYYSTQSAGGQ